MNIPALSLISFSAIAAPQQSLHNATVGNPPMQWPTSGVGALEPTRNTPSPEPLRVPALRIDADAWTVSGLPRRRREHSPVDPAKRNKSRRF